VFMKRIEADPIEKMPEEQLLEIYQELKPVADLVAKLEVVLNGAIKEVAA
jgi:hypothetical protein